ncbi:MAG: hypothetical protein N4J56_002329 [Chroococcidiopsis sp. SAG 2025]|uniref:glycosyltransferase family 39 protein n=1 Tax=Chroococcidiopsis sp. SAG 2025 TaxID=171389 RepID=UPI002936E7B6|nr:glycosyltransferase family 39 protein [Chroococcidiopsis sp. SAG 2025]MDV2992675.1 hypothetical protein [Chroococcidiopsis sp. SAG 2025]
MLLQRTSRERIRTSNFKYYLILGLTLAIGIFLRFFLLPDKSLWLDEGASLYYSDGTSIQAIISTIVSTDTGDRFQPFYYLVLHFWRQIFGSSEFAVRSLSALLGIGTIVVLCTTAWQLYGRKHALWLTLFLSFSAYGVYYSQQTRAYTLLLFLASLQLYFLSQILPQKNIRGTAIAQVLFCITTAIGLFCSIFIGIYTLALCIAHLLVSKNIKRWLQWWLPVAIACVPAAIFYLASPVATDPTKVHVTPSNQSVIQNIAFVFYGLLVGETYGPPIEQMRGGDRLQLVFGYLPILLLFVLVAGMIFIGILRGLKARSPEYKQYRPIDRFFLITFTAAFIIALAFAIVTKFNWLPRHSFYIYIPLAFLLPIALRSGSSSKKTHWKSLYRLAFIVLLLLNLYANYNYYFEPRYQRENYREIAQYLSKNNSQDTKSVLLYGVPYLLPYYGDTLTIDGLGLDTTKLAAEVSRVTKNANTAIIAISDQAFWEKKRNFDLESSMAKSYKLESHLQLTNFDIYHYVKK